MDGQVTWSDLGISCGKTWSEPLAATKEETSRQSSKKSSKSSNRKPPVLKCLKRDGLPGGATTMKWEDDGAWCGELTTLRTGEKPSETAVQEMLSVWGPHSVAEESRLSQILEETPHPKYNLTAKACLGILRRAERRGKDLPERLKAVLIQQSQGASPQERTEAPAPTEAPTSYAVRIRGGCDGGGKGALVQTEKSGTLGTGNDQTIFCLQGNGIDRADTAGCNGKGWKADESYTLNTIDRPAVCAEVAPVVALDMTHACDVIRECGEQVPALQARMGTGGNQVPLTYQMNGFGDYRAAEVASSCKQRDFKDSTDLVCGVTPDAARAILYQPKSAMEENWAESETKNALRAGESKVSHAVVCEDVSHALRAKANCAYREDAETYPVQNMVVRRLTPMECERLQGFPDHWTDIGEWIDEKGKKHKDADSPRYKALGNSIALPFWDWMLRRMARYLPAGATLGSLFDGIAGYPLIWERIHGRGTARWASEIEPFPIAVTKKHFPEEE